MRKTSAWVSVRNVVRQLAGLPFSNVNRDAKPVVARESDRIAAVILKPEKAARPGGLIPFTQASVAQSDILHRRAANFTQNALVTAADKRVVRRSDQLSKRYPA